MNVRNLVLGLAMLGTLAAQTVDVEVLLQRAMRLERVEGDLSAAIDLYKEVVTRAGKNRGAAAKALLRLGECYEKQGNSEARKSYQRVVSEFSDQAEQARLARIRLSALVKSSDDKSPTVAQLVKKGADVGLEGRVSANGRTYVFVDAASGNIFVRDLISGTARPVTKGATGIGLGRARGFLPLPSPDGKHVAYKWRGTSGEIQLRVVNVDGNGERVIASDAAVFDYRPLDWSTDGKTILAAALSKRSFDGVFVDLATGETRRFAAFRLIGVTHASLSADARWIVYSRRVKPQSSDMDVFAMDVQTGNEVALVPSPGMDDYPIWLPGSDRLVFRSGRSGKLAMWMLRFKDGQVVGEPVSIKSDMGDYRPVGASRDGSIFYRLENRVSDIYQAQVDPQTLLVQGSPARAVDTYLGRNMLPAWSPSGDSFAYYSERDLGGDYRPVVRHADGRETVPAGASASGQTPYPHRPLHWCSGGERFSLFLPDASVRTFDARTGEEKQPTGRFSRLEPVTETFWIEPAVSPDCEAAFGLIGTRANRERRFVRHHFATREQNELWAGTGDPAYSAAVSPDGQWFAFREALGGDTRTQIAIVPTSGGAPRTLLTGDFLRLNWTPDSKRLILSQRYSYSDGRQGSEMVWISREGGSAQPMSLRVPDPLAPAPSLHPDGKRILYSGVETSSELWVLRDPPIH